MELATLVLKVDATGAVRQVEGLNKALGQNVTQASKTERALAGVSRGLGALGALVGVGSVTLLARQFVTAADNANLLSGRLKLVTTGSANLADVQDKLFASAQRTRTAYEATVALYARVARNAADLGRSQSELLRFTELVQMATQSSGATAQEAAAGMIQLSQALASGQLRGEELRSVMENMAGVSRALAQGLGVPIGELRKLAEAGELTADKVVGAVLKMDASIRGDFAKVPETAAGGWTRFKNALSQWAGEADKAEGTTQKLNRIFSWLADNVERATKALKDASPEGRAAAQAAADAAAFERRFPGALAAAAASRAAADAAAATAKAEQDKRDAIEAARKARFAEWQESKAFAAERKGWEDAELIRLGQIADAAHKANVARLGRTVPGTSNIAVGRPAGIGGPATVGTIGGTDPFAGDRAQGLRDYVNRIRSEMERAGQTAENVTRNFIENVQGSMATFFTDIFTNGSKSFANLWDSFKRFALDAIAQIAAKNVMGAILGAAGGGATGGLLGALGGGGLGILAGAGLLLGGLFGGRRSPRTPASQTPRVPSFEQSERARQALADASGFAESRSNAVRQSVGGILTESSASRIVATLESIRAGIRELVTLAQSGAMSGVANVTVNGAQAINESLQRISSGVDRALGSRQQELRLYAGVATLG